MIGRILKPFARIRGYTKKDLFEKYKEGFKKEKSEFLNNPDFFNNYEEVIDIPQLHSRGSLTLCPTPIGNLKDITLRQYQAIKTADILACEDTRVSGHLLELLDNYNLSNPRDVEFPPKNFEVFPERDEYTYGLSGDFISYTVEQIKKNREERGRGLMVSINSYNQEGRAPKLVKAIMAGLKVVLVSDAGTPLISDPGYSLVREAAKAGVKIETLPGPTAAITALSASGFPTQSFFYQGYLTKTKSEKIFRLEKLKSTECTTIIYESSHRIFDTLECLKEVFGKKHQIFIGQEMTKFHEKLYRGSIEEVCEEMKLEENAKGRVHGELTIVISPFISEEEEETIRLNVKEVIATLVETIDGTPKKIGKLVNLLTGYSANKAAAYAVKGDETEEEEEDENLEGKGGEESDGVPEVFQQILKK
ncbi:unnamed protein product [Blepharisma stoltei]|uniref:Tetrapyrrole methylase domain-containing protein n=1 Tax=Blepharisma stoltei TaxID=1481888 RepID=A0AAU9J923_9CILI|nr:unnamed protein product [Blepharisma stoltei]